MSKTSRVATAVAAGYVLGRFKKLRMAVMVGSAMANDNVRNAALNYVKKGSGGLVASPGGTLTQQLGSKLMDAGKAAAVAAAASRVDSFSDRLATRSQTLRGVDADAPPEDDIEPEDEYESAEDEYDDEYEDEDEDLDDEEYADEDEEAEQPASRSRRGRSKSSARSGG